MTNIVQISQLFNFTQPCLYPRLNRSGFLLYGTAFPDTVIAGQTQVNAQQPLPQPQKSVPLKPDSLPPLRELPKTPADIIQADSCCNEKSQVPDHYLNYCSYIRRNVFKSVIRNMNSYFRKNRNAINKILKEAGFLEDKIKQGMMLLRSYNETELKEDAKTYQKVVDDIVEKRGVLTYVLKETLSNLLKNWEQGNYGKVFSHNLKAYKDICIVYLNKAVQIILNGKSNHK